MKIRYGFVSNSSSSNFVCMGVGVNSNEIKKENELELIRLFGCKPEDGLYEALEKLKEVKYTCGEPSELLSGKNLFIGNCFTWSNDNPEGFSWDIDRLMTDDQRKELVQVCCVLGIPYKLKLYAGVLYN